MTILCQDLNIIVLACYDDCETHSESQITRLKANIDIFVQTLNRTSNTGRKYESGWQHT